MQYININEINFASLLKEELDKTSIYNNICLISKQPLDSTKISLMCGHAFNYLPLYREILTQKTEHNILNTVKLKPYQIQCPYCRNIQNMVLPHKSYDTVDKIYGVNAPKRWEMLLDKCIYTFKYGKNKNNKCGKPCNQEYCLSHFNYLQKKKQKLETTTLQTNTIITPSTTCSNKINIYNKKYTIKNQVTDIIHNLDTMTVKSMKIYAKQYNIKQYYKMTKMELYNKLGQYSCNNSTDTILPN